jgi:hypothetical protein
LHLGEDEFHEACQTDPDGTRAILLEARTFSAAASADSAGLLDMPLTGALSHIALPCMRRQESLEFWQHYGIIAVEADAADTTELHTPGLVAHLREGTRQIELYFVPADFSLSQTAAAASDNAVAALPGAYSLTAPEGTRLIVLDTRAAN